MTIKDIARRAGVSASTVSRVLSGSERISAETTRRVQAIMREVNYTPNQLARSLVNRTSNIIAALLPMVPAKSLSEPFLFDVLRGIGEEAGRLGYNVLLSTGVDPAGDVESMRELVQGGIVSGIILLTSRVGDQLTEQLMLQRFPFVVLGTPDKAQEISWVDSDNVLAGRFVTEHLIVRGCRRIAFVGADDSHRMNVDRRLGWRQALEAAGLPHSDALVLPVRYAKSELDHTAITRMFSGPKRPDGVVATSDMQALNCMNAVQELGLSAPQDVSFVSFNNTVVGRYQKPALTTVDLDPAELGRQCFLLLHPRMTDPQRAPASTIVPFHLIERESVR